MLSISYSILSLLIGQILIINWLQEYSKKLSTVSHVGYCHTLSFFVQGVLTAEPSTWDTEPITVVTFSSRKRGLQQLPGYFGSLLQNTAASRIDLHFIADEFAFRLVKDCESQLKKYLLNITLTNLEAFESSHILYTHYQHFFKTGVVNPKFIDNNLYQRYHTAIYKLDVVNMVPAHKRRAMILDIDMLVLEDLSHMWHEADKLDSVGKILYATFEGYKEDSYFTGGTKYKNTKTHFYPPYGINTGAIIVDLDLMRQENLTAQRFIDLNDEPPRIPDQDIFNTWAFYNPSKIGILPCRWNTREYVPCFQRNVTFNLSRIDRGIFHGNNMKGLSPFIMEPTAEYAFEQELHKNYSKIFFEVCRITPTMMTAAVQSAHQSEAKITRQSR